MNDQELIAALAEGNLTPEEIREAEARVADNPELAEELRLQRSALDALGTLERPTLTDLERQRLHQAIAVERSSRAGADEVATAAAAPTSGPSAAKPVTKPKRRNWYTTLAPALAAAFVIVVGIGLFGSVLQGGSGSDDAAVEATVAGDTPEAAFQAQPAETAIPATTAAATDRDAMVAESADAGSVAEDEGQLFYADIDDLVDVLGKSGALNASALRLQTLERVSTPEPPPAAAADTESAACELPLGEQVGVFIGESEAAVVFLEDGTGWTVIDLATCQPLADSASLE